MGNNLFGANISGLVAAALGPGLLEIKFTKVYAGERHEDELTSGLHPSEETFDCRGIRQSISTVVRDSSHEGTQIPKNRQIVLILGDTLNGGNTVPEVGDRIFMENTNLVIDDVNFDADRAAYTCQVS